jgi:cell division protein FtsW
MLLLTTIYFTADLLPDWAGRVHTFKERIDDFLFGEKQQEEGTTRPIMPKLAIYEGWSYRKGPGGSEVSNYMKQL